MGHKIWREYYLVLNTDKQKNLADWCLSSWRQRRGGLTATGSLAFILQTAGPKTLFQDQKSFTKGYTSWAYWTRLNVNVSHSPRPTGLLETNLLNLTPMVWEEIPAVGYRYCREDDWLRPSIRPQCIMWELLEKSYEHAEAQSASCSCRFSGWGQIRIPNLSGQSALVFIMLTVTTLSWSLIHWINHETTKDSSLLSYSILITALAKSIYMLEQQ